jgi:carboxymethylenebutenolidase
MGQIKLTAADGWSLDGYRADPKGAARGGLVVCQEIFGVNHHIRSVCDRFAEAGYLAVAPALFDRAQKGVEFGYTPDDIAKGREVMQKLNLDNAMKDVAAAIETARQVGRSASSGIVGAAPSHGLRRPDSTGLLARSATMAEGSAGSSTRSRAAQ